MTAIDDWIAQLNQNRFSSDAQDLRSNVDTVTAALALLNFGSGLLTFGTYVPVATLVTNVAAATPQSSIFARLGNVVMVFGSTLIDPTIGAVDTEIGLSLPIASNLGASSDLSGVANRNASAIAGLAGFCFGDAANNRCRMEYLNDADVANRMWQFVFGYTII
jgi:hypothetical protein